MKTPLTLLAVACAILISACATPPPVSGSVDTKFGGFRLLPDGRIEITVNPKSAK
ncbi:MAG: hypothetical protein WCK77_23850 [Verrucomicrobiota bacterium]